MNKSKKIFIFVALIAIIVGLITYLYTKKTNETNNENQVYSIKNKNFYLYEESERDEEYRGIKLLEYDNSASDYAEIYYILYDYTTEPSFYYTLEIKDESNKNLLLDGANEQKIVGGMISSVKIKKQNLNENIIFYVYEKNEETASIEDSANAKISLKNDLEAKKIIDQAKNLKEHNLDGVSFKYIDHEYIYFGTTSHAYSDRLIGENCSIPIKSQYGNYLMNEEHIDFSYDKNVNNLSLEEAYESLYLINKNMGQYGLSDVYGLYRSNSEGEHIETIIVSFEEMINLCKGQTITVNGKDYNKKLFEDGFATISMYKDDEVEIGNGIKAIKYHYENNEHMENYIFVHKDNIYEISVPKNNRTTKEVQRFLESLKINN